jgi:23S rRNA (cytosine1962-C5)-methyltransferase
VWVYRSDLISADGTPPGAVVQVVDPKGKPLGTALYSSSSQIAIRLISTRAVEDLSTLVRERIRNAIAYRDLVVHNTDAYRVVFSEGDLLPGLVVDRYNDVLSLQILTQAMDSDAIREAITPELQKQLRPAGIIERVDARVRELEQLPERQSALIAGDKSSTVVTMNGIKFRYAGLEGQKTGSFLDQRENYAAAAQYAHGDALDVFCYQGGFALHLARKCSAVIGIDSSRPALEIADQNAALNDREIDWMEANAFDLLKDYSAAGRQYDTIVLDPPAFAKSRKDLDTAVRGYKELNLRALKMLRTGGILVTCTCSYHVGLSDFLSTISDAAIDVHRALRILEVRSQAKDHPVLLNVPETSYLKCVICHVSG